MSKPFHDGIRTPFSSFVREYEITTKEGRKTFSYIPWATSIGLADRPHMSVVPAEDGAYTHSIFGGVAVAIQSTLPNGEGQITWLPVLNGANQSIPEAKVTSRDISDTLNRCRAKAVAMVHGVGLSLYATTEGDNTDIRAFLKGLNVTPESDLYRVNPVVQRSDKKSGPYIDWPHAIAAARITDADFWWEVVPHHVTDTQTGEVGMKPFTRLGNGWAVVVRITYKGQTREEILPIMGFKVVETKKGEKKLDHQPLEYPTVADWNRSVMRCLVKAIAMYAGYGLGTYAKAETGSLNVEPLRKKGATAKDAEETVDAEESPAETKDEAAERAELVFRLGEAITAAGREMGDLLVWLGKKRDAPLDSLSQEEITRGLQALKSAKKAASG